VRIDPRQALEEFLQGVIPFRALRQRLLQSSSFTILAAAAPGIEEFLTLSKIVGFEAMRSGVRRRPTYDLIVVDAPASGHSLPFLSTARTLAEMMPVGPIGKMAADVGSVLADPRRCAVLVVTIPEEMAVTETIEIAAGFGRSQAIAVGPLVVNALWPERFTPEEARWLLSAPVDPSDALVAAGRYHVEKRLRAEEHLARLRSSLRVEPVLFPFLAPAGAEPLSLRRLVTALEGALPVESHAPA
jgi:anion-transporting  ArsA/GET3 family ATPase